VECRFRVSDQVFISEDVGRYFLGQLVNHVFMVFFNLLGHGLDPNLPPLGELLGQALLGHQGVALRAGGVRVRGDDVEWVSDDPDYSLSVDRLSSLSRFVWKMCASDPYFIVVAHVALTSSAHHRFIKRSVGGLVIASVNSRDLLQELPE